MTWPNALRRCLRNVRTSELSVLALLLMTGCAHSAPSTYRKHRIETCGTGAVVPAYSNHRSYPSWDPTRPPPTARVVRCFATLDQARNRGYPPGAPRGSLIVGGVFLVPTGTTTARQCYTAARKLKYPVPCPQIAPAVSSQLPNCNDSGGCVLGRSWFGFQEYGFDVPPWYRGVSGGPIGHFWLLASKLGPAEDREILCKPLIRKVKFAGNTAALAHCNSIGGDISGHVVLYWTHHGVLVGVTVHGFTAENAAIDLAVAQHIRWISPRK